MLRTTGLIRGSRSLVFSAPSVSQSAGPSPVASLLRLSSLSESSDRLHSSLDVGCVSCSPFLSAPTSSLRRPLTTSTIVYAAKTGNSGSSRKGGKKSAEGEESNGTAVTKGSSGDRSSDDEAADLETTMEFGADESNDQWDEAVDEEFGDEDIEDEEGFEDEFEMFEDPQAGQLIDTAGVKWGELALQEARSVLAQEHMRLLGLELYAFRVIPANKRLDIRLDKLHDTFGSPSLDDVEVFSRDFATRLEQLLGEAEAGQIEIEVSSPGAERPVAVPRDLMRFKELPMRVEYELEGGKLDTKVFNIEVVDEAKGLSTWCLADVRVNRGERGRPMSKKQKSLKFDIPFSALKKVNLYIDV